MPDTPGTPDAGPEPIGYLGTPDAVEHPGFNEQSLRQCIVNTWGPAGAHVDVFDALLSRIGELEAERERFRNSPDDPKVLRSLRGLRAPNAREQEMEEVIEAARFVVRARHTGAMNTDAWIDQNLAPALEAYDERHDDVHGD